MALPSEIIVKLDDSTSIQLERLIAVLDRLAAVMEQQRAPEKPPATGGPYLEGNGE
jgi:hypothetical protein